MSDYTKGKWEQLGGGSSTVRILDNKYHCNIISPGLGIVADAYGKTQGEAEANSKLIAASPELLEVLKKTTTKLIETLEAMAENGGWHTYNPQTNPTVKEAQQLIDQLKATT